MTSCIKPDRNRDKDYFYSRETPYALLYDVNTWNNIRTNVNFDKHGDYSAFPPPSATDNMEGLFGQTNCKNLLPSEFNCNVGVLGLYPHDEVSEFRSNYDIATKGQGLSAMDTKNGEIFADSENDNICKKAYDKELIIDFGTYDKLIDAPITAMHKNWGSVRKKVTINGPIKDLSINESNFLTREIVYAPIISLS